ncbi:MAG: SEC-C domain-containing protein [Acidobacteria bacterium]|nr:SEC-C domain-containing protein [Acidobacteriota bacterium]
MAKLGSHKRPAVVRVQTMEQGERVLALCQEHGWQAVVGVEEDMPEDLTDLERLMNEKPAKPQPLRAPPKIGRNDYCPCGSGKKYKNCCAPPPEGTPAAT